MDADEDLRTVVGAAVDGLVRVTVTGTLTARSAATLRARLLKCPTDGPVALMVDVRRLRVPRTALLTVFPAVLGSHPDLLAVALVAPAPMVESWRGSGVLGVVTVHETTAEARAHLVAAPVRRYRTLRLPADHASAPAARRFVAAVCAEWGLARLTEPATVVVSELVSNALEHAGTPVRVSVHHREPYLYVAVRDGEPDSHVPDASPDRVDPAAVRGRGLYMVDFYAATRGVTRTALGKNVWAALRTTPVAAGGDDPP